MGLIFGDLNKALSIKSCYSKCLFSSSVFVMTFLLSAAFFVGDMSVNEVKISLTFSQDSPISSID
jgi:hypothetical protein